MKQFFSRNIHYHLIIFPHRKNCSGGAKNLHTPPEHDSGPNLVHRTPDKGSNKKLLQIGTRDRTHRSSSPIGHTGGPGSDLGFIV